MMLPSIVGSITNVEFSKYRELTGLMVIQPVHKSLVDGHDFLLQFYESLSWPVWLAIHIWLMITAIILCCTALPMSERRLRTKTITRTLINTVIKSYATLIDRSMFEPLNNAHAIISATLILGIFVLSSVAGNCVGAELVYTKSKLYESLQDILSVARDKVVVAWIKNSPSLSQFKRSGDHPTVPQQIHDKFYDKYISYIDALSLYYGFPDVVAKYQSVRHKIVLFEDSTYGEGFTGKLCERLDTSLTITSMSYGYNVELAYAYNRKLSLEMKELIEGTMERSLEHGFFSLHRLIKMAVLLNTDIRPTHERCYQNEHKIPSVDKLRPINIQDIRVAGKICVIVIQLSLIVHCWRLIRRVIIRIVIVAAQLSLRFLSAVSSDGSRYATRLHNPVR